MLDGDVPRWLLVWVPEAGRGDISSAGNRQSELSFCVLTIDCTEQVCEGMRVGEYEGDEDPILELQCHSVTLTHSYSHTFGVRKR